MEGDLDSCPETTAKQCREWDAVNLLTVFQEVEQLQQIYAKHLVSSLPNLII